MWLRVILQRGVIVLVATMPVSASAQVDTAWVRRYDQTPTGYARDVTCPLYYTLTGSAINVNFGFSVAGAGDVNGDGYADFIIGDDAALQAGHPPRGSAYVYSGRDGSLLYEKDGSAPGDWFGFSVAGAGDINRDGYADFIVGSNAPVGYASVYSGRDGTLLYRKNADIASDGFGRTADGAGDVNGDGYDDFIVGAPFTDLHGLTWVGSAYVYSGRDGSLLYRRDGTASYDLFAYSVAGAGDLNNDGHADFIVGAYLADPDGNPGAGSAYVYSGRDGSLLYRKDGTAGDAFGISVAGAEDINNDGYADFIVGALWANPGGRADAGSAFVYSGRDGALLYREDGAASDDYFGWSVAGAGDVDHDGHADFIVGACVASPRGLYKAGSAYVYSGRDGSLLCQEDGAVPEDYFGLSVSGAGDLNGDGYDEFVVGAVGHSHAYVYSCGGCSCPCHADPDCDGIGSDARAIVGTVDVAFGGHAPVIDPICPRYRTDVDCTGRTDVVDVIKVINVAIRGSNPATEYCHPCAP